MPWFNNKMKSKPAISEYLKKHWLLCGIFTCIFLACLYPSLGAKEGPLKPEYTVKYGAVSIIFFISGFSMRTENVYHTFQQYQLHLFIQTFTFLFIPLFIHALNVILSVLAVDVWILKGLMTVACMPPPVSSAVILTKSAHGNETAAIFNSVLGSFLGIIITPVLLLFNLGFTTVVPFFITVVQLICTVMLPLLLGQCLRIFTNFKGHKLPMNSISQCALLFVIYTTFCETFHTAETGLKASDILITMSLVFFVQLLLLSFCFTLACHFKIYSSSDIVCIMFCATHKSLTLGVPILRIMFHGLSHLSQISLPLLIYHPTQIILGGLLISSLKEWTYSKKPRRSAV